MDAITLLRQDHKTVEQLFKRFEKAGDGALVEKREIVDRIVEELSIHATIEEQLFYPVARATVPGTEDIALESLEEHHIVKWVLSELDGMDSAAERFDAKVTVLIENVRHHVEEEEGEFFPKVRDELGRKALGDLGEALEKAKSTAPTHPHPRSPDTPSVVGAIAGVIDRVTDNVSGVAQGSVLAVEDLIATVLRNKKPKASPTGSTVARKRANAVRKTAASATDGVAKTVATAGSGAAATTRAAKSGAKGTMTSARKSATATRTTAKRAATTTARTATRATKATAATAKRSASKTAAAARSGG
jgi:hemerythrin superfamily protein